MTNNKIHKDNDKQNNTAIGSILTAERQGNNYLKLTVKTSKDKKDILIWCSGDKTRVYASKKTATWNELVTGRKIKVVGDWINQDGEMLLWASKINLL